MSEPLVHDRQLCAVLVCHNIARRPFAGKMYCLPCFRSVFQAQYASSIPPEARERALYRNAMKADPPAGVILPDPLAALEGRPRR